MATEERKMYCKLPWLMLEKDPKLSQRKLAEQTGISLATINKLYNGRPMTARIDPATVETLCNYFGCNVGDLFEMKQQEAA